MQDLFLSIRKFLCIALSCFLTTEEPFLYIFHTISDKVKYNMKKMRGKNIFYF